MEEENRYDNFLTNNNNGLSPLGHEIPSFLMGRVDHTGRFEPGMSLLTQKSNFEDKT